MDFWEKEARFQGIIGLGCVQLLFHVLVVLVLLLRVLVMLGAICCAGCWLLLLCVLTMLGACVRGNVE